jgi:predicted NodU family carbamoyl transferase
MRILAFHAGLQDSSAAAFDDYELIAAVAEERLTRRRKSGGVPWLAIDEVLAIAGWQRGDVDAIATTRGLFPVQYLRLPLHQEIDHGLRRWLGRDRPERELSAVGRRTGVTRTGRLFRGDLFLAEYGFRPDVRLHFAGRHEAHALAALFFTDWEDGLVYTADGVGDTVSCSIRQLKAGRLDCHHGDDGRLAGRRAYKASLAIEAGAEDVALRAVRPWLARAQIRRLALAGGRFADGRLNRLLAESLPLDEIFIFPAMGDDGLSIGAGTTFLLARDGLATWLSRRRRLASLCLGRDYDGDIDHGLAAAGLVRMPGAPAEGAAALIAAGRIGAIYCGRMEFGPRALGARSILATPADPAVTESLRRRLERPDLPFAPVVLAEDAERVFEVTDVNRHAARFMTITTAVRPEWRARLPGIVDIDGTARPQIVTDADNPLYADILRRFRALTGLPALINTSLDGHEEPIVNRPRECLQAVIDRRIDFVVTAQALHAPMAAVEAPAIAAQAEPAEAEAEPAVIARVDAVTAGA